MAVGVADPVLNEPLERLEELADPVGRHRRAGVGDSQDGVIPRGYRADLHTAAGELYRMALSMRLAAMRSARSGSPRTVGWQSDTSYGEVGGPNQYGFDRLEWRVGEVVRNLARYAIIAVNGIVRRVYQISPEGWHETSPGYWESHAIGDRVCTDTEINAAYAAGLLPLRPGDDCPARAGGAYRPHWF